MHLQKLRRVVADIHRSRAVRGELVRGGSSDADGGVAAGDDDDFALHTFASTRRGDVSDAWNGFEVAFGGDALRELLGEGLEAAFGDCAGHDGW